MNVSLTPELEKLVNAQLESGKYNSVDEVIGEALRLLHEQEKQRQARLDALRQEVAMGAEQADRGELTAGDDAFDRLKKKHEAMYRDK